MDMRVRGKRAWFGVCISLHSFVKACQGGPSREAAMAAVAAVSGGRGGEHDVLPPHHSIRTACTAYTACSSCVCLGCWRWPLPNCSASACSPPPL